MSLNDQLGRMLAEGQQRASAQRRREIERGLALDRPTARELLDEFKAECGVRKAEGGVESRPVMSAEDHNRFPGGRW